MPRIILVGFCKQAVFLHNPVGYGQFNETKQKYKTLYQLLPWTFVVHLVVLVNLQANTATAGTGTGMAANENVNEWTHAMEFSAGSNINDY